MPIKKKNDPELVGKIFVKVEMLQSKAFKSLNSGSINVYFALRIKRKEQGLKFPAKDRSSIKISHIKLSYGDAKKESGFEPSTFRRAIEELREKGFLDVVKKGTGGSKPSPSIYQLSSRWKKYGTKAFDKK
jgi:hypothetical protein